MPMALMMANDDEADDEVYDDETDDERCHQMMLMINDAIR